MTRPATTAKHGITTYDASTGWGWTCVCGAANRGMPGQRTAEAARAAGLRHIRAAEDRRPQPREDGMSGQELEGITPRGN